MQETNADCIAKEASLGGWGARDRTATITIAVEVAADRTFEEVFSAVKSGHRITRAGWNGKDQYVTAQYPDKHSKMTVPYLVLKNAQGDFVPWAPSQGDLFATDWAVLSIQPIYA
jgi:hypothetical protein